MRKTITFLFAAIILFIASCSKDNDTNPKSDFTGTWAVTSESTVFLNTDGTSFRDNFITEDDVDSDPSYNVVITDEAMLLDGQTAIYNNLTSSSFNLNVDGESIKVDYTIKGNNMTWKSIELNKKIEYNGTVYTTIPKQVSTVTLTRK